MNSGVNHEHDPPIPEPWRLGVTQRPQVRRAAREKPSIGSPRSERASTLTELVVSHVETLIERVTGIDKATPDAHGNYVVQYRGGLYSIRVDDSNDQPIVRFFTPVVTGLEASPGLFEALNNVNTQLEFCRCFHVSECVSIEAEHLGATIRTEDFRQLVDRVAAASAALGSSLTKEFGGRRAFADADRPKDPELMTGLYL